VIKLKPCPFCGGEAYFDKDDDGWQWIECGKCHVATSQRASLMEDCKPLLAEAWNTRSAIDSEAKIKRVEELETELESARKDRRIAWDDANKAEAALSAIDPDAIRRECAYKAKQAILSAPYDNPTRAYAAALAEAAIFSAEPALNMPKCTKPDDAECHANSRGRCYNGFQCKPAQDDGKAESEESKDERLATKQLLGAGCHDECGPLPEEDQ